MSSEKKDYLRRGPPGFHAAGKFGRVAFFHHKLLGTHADHWFDWKHKGWLQERPIVRMLVISICVTQESDAPPLWRQVEES